LLRDDLDRAIVAELVADARSSYAEIGGSVGLSAPAVKRRVDRLIARGAIRGFTAIVDPQASGTSTEGFVELYCRTRTNPAEILRMVEPLPQVIAAYTITGDADALLHLKTSGTDEFEATLERIRSDPNAERTRSVLVLSRLLDRTHRLP
jgi:DNA-binding Lrp family transcriptional regulator